MYIVLNMSSSRLKNCFMNYVPRIITKLTNGLKPSSSCEHRASATHSL